MKTINMQTKLLLAVTAALIALPPVYAQSDPPPFKSPLKTLDGDDDDWFMEETTPKQPKRQPKITPGQAANVGVPLTDDGRIVPLKSDTPVMTQGSQLEISNEYVVQPGAYYPGFAQPYMGGVNPYFAPGVVPYGAPGGININLGRAGGISLGGGYPMYPTTYGYNTSTYTPLNGMPNSSVIINPAVPLNNGFIGTPGLVPNYGYGVPGMYAPGMNMGVPGMGGIGLPGIGLPGRRF
jgi:hypothetical protein